MKLHIPQYALNQKVKVKCSTPKEEQCKECPFRKNENGIVIRKGKIMKGVVQRYTVKNQFGSCDQIVFTEMSKCDK